MRGLLCCGGDARAVHDAWSPSRRRPAAPGRRRVPTIARRFSPRPAAAQQAGRDAEAMTLLRTAADRYQSVQALLQLARLQSARRQPQAAMATLGRRACLAPNSEEVLDAFAQLALAVKQPVPASSPCEPLTRMCPSVASTTTCSAWPDAGRRHAGGGRGAAEADRLEPERPLTLLALGLALNNRKLFAEAKAALSAASSCEPDNVEAVAALAEAEAGLGELDAAETRMRARSTRAPTSATAHLVLGLVRMKQRRYAEARDALLKALRRRSRLAQGGLPAQPRLRPARRRRRGQRSTVDLYQAKLREQTERIRELRAGVPGAAGPPGRASTPAPMKAVPDKKDHQ